MSNKEPIAVHSGVSAMLQKIPIKSKDEVQSSQSHVQPNAQHPLNAIATQSPYSQHLAQLSSIANVSAGVEAEG